MNEKPMSETIRRGRLRGLASMRGYSIALIDLLVTFVAVVLAHLASPRFELRLLETPGVKFVMYGLPIFMTLGLQLTGVQRIRAGFATVEVVLKTLYGIVGAALFFALANALTQYELIGRLVLLFSIINGVALVVGTRLFLWKLAEHSSSRVLVVGDRAAFEYVRGSLEKERVPVRVIAYTGNGPHEVQLDNEVRFREGGLLAYCATAGIDEIVVDLRHVGTNGRRELMTCSGAGIDVMDRLAFIEHHCERIDSSAIEESWFWNYAPAHRSPYFLFSKRVIDVFASLCGIIVCSPLAVVVGCVIWLSDRGPIFYTQTRLGLYNRPFKIFKFRSMKVDAERHGAQWAKPSDSRVTLFGRILRKSRFDETPQFINILRGEMSFVGPRPERPEFMNSIEHAVTFFRYRHLVTPGLTGWAQINYPYGASVEDARRKLEFDLYYVKHASIQMDLLIMFRTLVAMVRGAR